MEKYGPGELERVQQIALEVLREFICICNKYGLKYFVHWGTAIGTVRHQGFIPWDDDVDVGMIREDYDRFMEVAPDEIGGRYTISSAFIQKNCFGMYATMWKDNTLHMTRQENLWPGKHGIRIDIFPFDYVPEDDVLRAKQIRKVAFWNRLYVMKNLSHPHIPGDSLKAKLVRGVSFLGHYVMKLMPMEMILRHADGWARKYQGKSRLMTLIYYSDAEKWKLWLDDIYPLQTGMFEGTEVSVMHRNHEALTASYGDYMTLPPEEERVNHYQGILSFGDEV